MCGLGEDLPTRRRPADSAKICRLGEDLPTRRRCADSARMCRLGLGLVLAALEVPLELPGDGLTRRLGEVGGVAGLLEGPDVLGDVLVLLGQLVDAALPGPG